MVLSLVLSYPLAYEGTALPSPPGPLVYLVSSRTHLPMAFSGSGTETEKLPDETKMGSLSCLQPCGVQPLARRAPIAFLEGERGCMDELLSGIITRDGSLLWYLDL